KALHQLRIHDGELLKGLTDAFASATDQDRELALEAEEAGVSFPVEDINASTLAVMRHLHELAFYPKGKREEKNPFCHLLQGLLRRSTSRGTSSKTSSSGTTTKLSLGERFEALHFLSCCKVWDEPEEIKRTWVIA
ncbi:unnamed protein product, partial [Amoebophrya sp. A25]